MRNRRLGFYLIVGILLGLLVTACGVAAIAPTDGASGPSLLGPIIDTLSLPAVDVAAPQAPAHLMRSMALQRAAEAAAQSGAQMYGPGDHCSRSGQLPEDD